MKIMILSTATGGGHNSAGKAIEEYFKFSNCETYFADALNFKSGRASARASTIYTEVTRHMPKVFGVVYKLGDLVSSTKITSPVYLANAQYAHNLMKKIEEFKPDAIVCPHIYPAEAITWLRHKGVLKIPTIGISTDYTCAPFWEEADLDYLVIPHKDLVNEFLKKGFKKEKILPFGIPVSSKFREKIDNETAKKEFGLKEKHVYTVMGGSMGFGNMEKTADDILSIDKEAEIVMVCGHNQKLFLKMHNKDRVKAYNFIDNVNVLMDATDVLLTKPGGLSSTEAINKNVPLVLTAPIPGCETINAKFFEPFGVAKVAKTSAEASKMAVELNSNTQEKEKMLEAQKEFSKLDAQKAVGEFIQNLVKSTK